MEKDLTQLSPSELGRLFPIEVVEYQAVWCERYQQEKDHLIALLGSQIVLRIEHFGSTAVPGLAAKPTVDILIEIPPGKNIQNVVMKIMTTNGYHYMREQTGHLMFVKGYTPDGFQGQVFHIHMGVKENNDLWVRLLFRDYLLANRAVAAEYAKLKKELAIRFKNDREAYTEAKTGFIKRMTEKAKHAAVKN